MSLTDQQFIFAQNVSLLINYIFNKRHKCTLGEAYRTHEQAEIYAKEGKGIVDSLHCKRLAIDLNLFYPNNELITDPKDYLEFGVYWEKLHAYNKWGGFFKKLVDLGHFEMDLVPKN